MNAAAVPTLPALARRFLAIGCTAWGGPVVQIATLHTELVERAHWATPQHFRRALAVYQALPGPEATEMCVWFGTLVRGRPGGLCAGLCFVLPGLVVMLLTCALLQGLSPWPSWLGAAITGMQCAALALLLRAAQRLLVVGTQRRPVACGVALLAGVGAWLGVPFAVGLVAGGLAVLASELPRRLSLGAAGSRGHGPLLALIGAAWLAIVVWHVTTNPTADAATAGPHRAADLATLAVTGLRAGLLTFGGAYTAIPFLQADATGPGGWMSDSAMLSGIAVGSVLPAPMIIVGTWVGWAGGGLPGALLVTLGIFLPAFLFPLLLHDRLERLTRQRGLHAFLDGIAATVAGLVLTTALQLGAQTLGQHGLPGAAVTGIVLVALARWRGRPAVPLVMLGAGLAAALLGAARA